MRLTGSDLDELVAFRHRLHRYPEVSGAEVWTAGAVGEFLEGCSPDRVLRGVGGHGVAAVFEGVEEGPTVLIRAELDALPIEEISDLEYRSTVPGVGHQCGHDGHSAILAGVGMVLGRGRPKRGRVVLLFQPAEETGEGAVGVLGDERFGEIAPDYAFALHNMPGLPLGFAGLSVGPVNCASRGMRVVFRGRTAHSSMPETGVSPMRALAGLMPKLEEFSRGDSSDESFRLVTVTHTVLGQAVFGIAPGSAELWATLRTLRNSEMSALVEAVEELVRRVALEEGLGVEIEYREVFEHCENDASAVEILRAAFDAEGVPHGEVAPMRASEDFGVFGRVAKSAMFLMGAGESRPQLHNPDYDFPDELIEPSVRIFVRVVDDLLGLGD